MCCVGDPIEPVEFLEDGLAGADFRAVVQVVVVWDVIGEEELAAGDFGELGLDEGKLGGERGGVAILGAVEDPGDVAAGHVRGVFCNDGARDGAGALVPEGFGLAGYVELLDDVAELGDVAEDAVEGEGADDFHDGLEVVFAEEGHHVGLVAGRGHEPEAHLCDDAVVGLGEHAVREGAVGGLEGLPCRVVGVVFAGEGAHSGSEDGAVWEDDLHAAVVGKVVAIRGVAYASIKSVAHNATAAEIRGVDP